MLEIRPSDDPNLPEPTTETGPKSTDRVVHTVELFGDRREIWIEHHGERYRLRITRRNKLILQK